MGNTYLAVPVLRFARDALFVVVLVNHGELVRHETVLPAVPAVGIHLRVAHFEEHGKVVGRVRLASRVDDQTAVPAAHQEPPDCKKINVSLVWAISRRNVVNGKYLPALHAEAAHFPLLQNVLQLGEVIHPPGEPADDFAGVFAENGDGGG